MRILILTYEMTGAGGNFIRSFSLAKSLVALDHQVTLLSAHTKMAWMVHKESRSGVQILAFPGIFTKPIRHGGLDPLDLLRRLKYGRHRRFDIMHGFGHRPTVALAARAYGRRHKVPFVADWCDLFGMDGIGSQRSWLARITLGKADDAWERTAYTNVDGLTVISNALEKRAIALGVPSSRIQLLPVGANLEIIRPQDKGMMREKHGLPQDVPIVTYVGMTRYDDAFLGRIFVELARRNDKVLILMIGRHAPEFDKVVEEANLRSRVIYRGFVPYNQLGEQLACGDVMLLPYTNQSINTGRYPNKIGDYMAAGRPTVANPTGDLKCLIEEERVGLLAPEDPRAFADKVQQLIETPGLAHEMGKHARQVAERKCSWMSLARVLGDFYTSVMSKR